MQENGVLLYSKEYQNVYFDTNLLIGFFASIANFSREALNTAVKNVDLGEENKVILQANPKEGLMAAAIVSPGDNISLIQEILTNIILDFINEFPSFEDPERLDRATIELIFKVNMRRKTFPSPPLLLTASLILLTPVLIILVFISIYLTNAFQELFYNFTFSLVVYTSITLLFLTVIPNLISGFLAPDKRYAWFNTFAIIAFEVVFYVVSVERLFAQITLANLPINFLLSIASAYFGFQLSSRRYLKK